MEFPNYHHLRYFWMVAKEGGLTRAAAKLHVSQPTISAQLRALEGVLGEKLFRRDGRQLALTDAGQHVLTYAEEIFAIGQDLLNSVKQRPTSRPLRVNVGVAPREVLRRMPRRLLWVALTLVGCASAPEVYQPTEPMYVLDQIELPDAEQRIERGRSVPLLDGLNHYVLSLPTKVLLLNRRIQDHEISDRDRQVLERYLQMNQLTSVKVRHNQWAPIDEWRRMWRNDQVGIGYRATLGVISWLRYTLFPDRVFGGLPIPFVGGGDHFNPFSNTVHVFSSDLAILLHEGGHAKDYVRHRARGTTFVLLRLLPGIDLIQEAVASQDAIQFLYCIRDDGAEVHACRLTTSPPTPTTDTCASA